MRQKRKRSVEEAAPSWAWKCPSCTFLNAEREDRCEMCFTENQQLMEAQMQAAAEANVDYAPGADVPTVMELSNKIIMPVDNAEQVMDDVARLYKALKYELLAPLDEALLRRLQLHEKHASFKRYEAQLVEDRAQGVNVEDEPFTWTIIQACNVLLYLTLRSQQHFRQDEDGGITLPYAPRPSWWVS